MMAPVHVIAAFILLTEPGAINTDDVPDETGMLRVALTGLCQQLEILDEREGKYMFTAVVWVNGVYPPKYNDLKRVRSSDISLVRNRFRSLYDAPPLHDHMRFPDRQLVNELLSFNRLYRQYLDNQLEFTPDYDRFALRQLIADVDWLYTTYDKIRDAECDYYYITVRREALKAVRERLGMDAYYNGYLPPVVPLYAFREIR